LDAATAGFELTVEDAGPGMTEAALERGVSGAASTGLGLDIVRRSAELTGGTITLDRSELGGACVRVRFGSARPALTKT
jgi:signal transduction histidine kinase